MATTIASPPLLADQRSPINQVVIFGDSLSDRGLLNKKTKDLCHEVFRNAPFHGSIPYVGLQKILGFDDSSTKRFTNGYTWSDDLSVNIMNNNFAGQKSTCNLQDPNKVTYSDGCILLRSYAEGGATSANYRTFSQVWKYTKQALKDLLHFRFKQFKTDIADGFSSLILTRIDKERGDFLKDDRNNMDKSKTLIIEWSGANDLLTVNNELLAKNYDSTAIENEIDRAVNARLNNIEALIKNGYTNFTLIGIPDFSVTPRLQRQSKAIQQRANHVVDEFNAKLKSGCEKLQDKYGDSINIDFFDINPQLKAIYQNPEEYGFDPDKKTNPFIESKASRDEKKGNFGFCDGSTPENIKDKYMFWDDIHPSSRTHEILGEEIYKTIDSTYRFEHVDAAKQSTSYDTDAILDANSKTCKYSSNPAVESSAKPVPKVNNDENENKKSLTAYIKNI